MEDGILHTLVTIDHESILCYMYTRTRANIVEALWPHTLVWHVKPCDPQNMTALLYRALSNLVCVPVGAFVQQAALAHFMVRVTDSAYTACCIVMEIFIGRVTLTIIVIIIVTI